MALEEALPDILLFCRTCGQESWASYVIPRNCRPISNGSFLHNGFLMMPYGGLSLVAYKQLNVVRHARRLTAVLFDAGQVPRREIADSLPE